jgi:hypothetical protein
MPARLTMLALALALVLLAAPGDHVPVVEGSPPEFVSWSN